MARIGVKPPTHEKAEGPAPLPKVGIRNTKGAETSGVTGPAVEQNRATQFLINDSPLTTGNKNYKSPGCEGGMS